MKPTAALHAFLLLAPLAVVYAQISPPPASPPTARGR